MPVLIYGFYGSNAHNIGDKLFKEAFYHLLPDVELVFTDKLTKHNISQASLIIFGGGSFLYDPPKMEDGVFPLLEKKLLCYIGVGIENIHPMHQEFIKQAKVVAIRNHNGLAKTLALNSNAFVIPDLVYSLPITQSIKKPNSILILPNIEVTPKNSSPFWMHTSWAQFKSEISQFIDELPNYTIDFANMCTIKNLKDMGATYEIINMTKKRNFNIFDLQADINVLSSLFSSYETIITQRYHGIVLSEMVNSSCISIAHHDKLKNHLLDSTTVISYYELHKQKLFDGMKKKEPKASINLNSFGELKTKISSLF